MNRISYKTLFHKTPVILDGAMGTRLIEEGMPSGVCPEKWASENIELVEKIQREYVESGAKIIYSFTFGANEIKLADYGLEVETESINIALTRAAKRAAGKNALVAGDISSTGVFIEPLGELSFEKAVSVFKRQAKALADAGADIIIIETISDIQEARAALIGAREACDLPVWVTMTFDESGRTLTGTDAKTAALTLCALGADAIGTNCGLGPELMTDIIKDMKRVSTVPVIAKPNAGLPSGSTMQAEEFAQKTLKLLEAGADAVGGCCGTNCQHVKTLVVTSHKEAEGSHRLNLKDDISLLKSATGIEPLSRKKQSLPACVTSVSRTAHIAEDDFLVIGERINPSGKKKLQQAILNDDIEYIISLAAEQKAAGADVLDVNLGMPGIDEAARLKKYVLELSGRVELPLCIDSANPEAIEGALRVYPGRALVNSVSAETGKAEKLFPAIKKYGAMYIALPLGEDGVPNTAEGRIEHIKFILRKAEEYGIPRSSAVIDAIALSVASEHDAGREALKVIDWCRENSLATVMGVSNISFGLPERAAFNASMLCCGMARGLTCGIVNICDESMAKSIKAAKAILKGGSAAEEYARAYSVPQTQEKGLFGAVTSGNRGNLEQLIDALLTEGNTPLEIIEKEIIPALDVVGERFGEKKIFLPQLMASAEAAKAAFAILEPMIAEQESKKKVRVVLATVKGDIHDIGKNIVGLMLKNHGFEVIDLGRNVPNEEIIKAAVEHDAAIIGLSALITTTMPQMGECAELIRKNGIKAKLMVGGAVVTPDYADEIGAYYAHDAAKGVELAKRLVNEFNL